MEGGVRVTKQKNIFNLIRNPDATVDDLRKLIDIAPGKLREKEDGRNPLDLADSLNKEEMVKFLKEKGLKKTDFTEKETYNLILKCRTLEEIEDVINDKDLSFLTATQQKNIIEKFYHTLPIVKELINHNFNVNTIIPLVNGIPLISYYCKPEFIQFAKLLLDKGADPNITDYYFYSPLEYALTYKNLELIKKLIEKGANINYRKTGTLSYFKRIFNDKLDLPYYKVFIDAGMNPDTPVDDVYKTTMLMVAAGLNNKELFDFFLENGADVNYKSFDTQTIIILVSSTKPNLYFLKKVIEKGADINHKTRDGGTALLYAVFYANSQEHIECIKYLLEKGADKTIKSTHGEIAGETASDIARRKYNNNPEIYKKILELLGESIKEEKWKGSTRSDIEKYDIFFEKPNDWSCCPICLEYIERSDGCMYMSHNCASTKHFYHKKLYDTYAYHRFEGAEKKVEWCTICGRVTKFHKHFILSSANAPSKEIAPILPEIQERLDRGDNQAFFDNANCIAFGGGGLEEKATRFRRLREYALELQEDIDKKSNDDVLNELIEEVFNAPLVRSRKIKKILEDKRWNINIKEFPENTKKNNTRNNVNAPNIPFNGTLPTKLDSLEHECIIMTDDDEGKEGNPTFKFHHERVGGIDHDGIFICQNDLSRAIEIANKEFGGERFGKCWFPTCKGTLHPEEIKGIVPEVLYEEYRKKFNKKMKQEGGKRKNATRKMKKQRGGNNESVLHKLDLSNATCTPPNFTKDGKLRKIN